jgi:hypothetical protein
MRSSSTAVAGTSSGYEIRRAARARMFIELHYTSGRQFLVNVDTIAGVEINGTAEKGCVVTLTTFDDDGGPRYETVRETYNEIMRRLGHAGLVVMG